MTIAAKLLQINGVKEDIRDAIESFGYDLSNVPFTQYAEWIAIIGSETHITVTAGGNTGTISDDLGELEKVKSDIKNAIESKGISLTNVPFTEYAQYIYQIPVGQTVTVSVSAGEDVNGGTVTGSGTYTSGQTVTVGGTPIYGRRVRSITVNGTVVSTGNNSYSFVPSASINNVVVNFMPDYLTFTVVDADVTVGMKGDSDGNTASFVVEFAQLVDDVTNETWTQRTFRPARYNGTHQTITLLSGNTYVVRKQASGYGCSYGATGGTNRWFKNFIFTGNGYINASGNVLSLFDKECATKTLLVSNTNQSIFRDLFNGCGKLLTAPKVPECEGELPAYAFYQMFYNCQKLRSIPSVIKCSSVRTASCQNMFAKCGISGDPSFPKDFSYSVLVDITTIPSGAGNALYGMFQNSKIASCEITTTVISNSSALNYMFNMSDVSVSEFRDITVHFTSWPTCQNWLYHVRGNGSFYKPSDLPTEWGDNRIPTGWNPINISQS